MTTPRPAAEAAEGTRPAGQAEALRPGPCTRCYADGYPACMCVVDYDKPAAGVGPPVVAVAGREASAPDYGGFWVDWLPLHVDGELTVEEGNTYLFAIETSTGWDYFTDAIVWDSETEPHWYEAQSGWEIDDVGFYTSISAPVKP